MMRPGPNNLITDVSGLRVGNAEDPTIKTGVTVVTADDPFTAGVHVMGGAPGTRETDALAPENLVQQVDALVLSGGSALGLSAASGVADALRAQGRGFAVGGQNVPIVPAAILFDLTNGGHKNWPENPYPNLGAEALDAAAHDFELGTIGAGYGATTANLKGGLGSASLLLPSGHTVGALAVVNAVGSVVVPDTAHFWAAPWEHGSEFGGLGQAAHTDPTTLPTTKFGPRANTTIAIVATDATLSQSQTKRMAISAHGGLARAIVPSHTPYDGDLVFAAATGAMPASDDPALDMMLGHTAAVCLSRAIARGVFAARPTDGDLLPCWSGLSFAQ